MDVFDPCYKEYITIDGVVYNSILHYVFCQFCFTTSGTKDYLLALQHPTSITQVPKQILTDESYYYLYYRALQEQCDQHPWRFVKLTHVRELPSFLLFPVYSVALKDYVSSLYAIL